MTDNKPPSSTADTFKPWRTVSKRDVLTVPDRFTISVETVELPDGRIIDDYWQIDATNYVVIFAETAAEEVICLRQYRHGPRREGLELVAGHIEASETPFDAARRELREETGYESQDWEALGSYVVSASQGSGVVYFFRARQAVKRGEPSSGDLESATIVLLTEAQLVAALSQGQFTTADHVAGIGVALLASRPNPHD